MSSQPTSAKSTPWRRAVPLLLLALCLLLSPRPAAAAETIVVTAVGLADPQAEIYQRDKGMMIDDLRRDAQRQAIEKAVGVYVESSTLVENYLLIEDRVLSKSSGLIKQILNQTTPQLRDDGLMHMEITAEVFISDVREALESLGRESRLSLLKERGNPTISVAIVVRDAQRGGDAAMENSSIAENILKEHFVEFGYRVWSEDYTKLLQREAGAAASGRRVADFSVIGEARFRQTSVTLKASGLTLNKHALTSWTVKGIDNHTGEEIYFNNKVPKNTSWADEEQALEDIGRLIGKEFSKDFFESQLMKPSRLYQIQLTGLPDYDTAQLFQEEFIGLRNILNAELINFESGGLTQMEVEVSGSGGSGFLQIVNNTILKPLNAKLDGNKLKLASAHGNVIRIAVEGGQEPGGLQQALLSSPPAGLATASPARIAALVQDPQILAQLVRMNPALAAIVSAAAGKTP